MTLREETQTWREPTLDEEDVAQRFNGLTLFEAIGLAVPDGHEYGCHSMGPLADWIGTPLARKMLRENDWAMVHAYHSALQTKRGRPFGTKGKTIRLKNPALHVAARLVQMVRIRWLADTNLTVVPRCETIKIIALVSREMKSRLSTLGQAPLDEDGVCFIFEKSHPIRVSENEVLRHLPDAKQLTEGWGFTLAARWRRDAARSKMIRSNQSRE